VHGGTTPLPANHFWMRIFSGRVPVCAATSFLRSPMVSSSLQRQRTERGAFATIR